MENLVIKYKKIDTFSTPVESDEGHMNENHT